MLVKIKGLSSASTVADDVTQTQNALGAAIGDAMRANILVRKNTAAVNAAHDALDTANKSKVKKDIDAAKGVLELADTALATSQVAVNEANDNDESITQDLEALLED